MGARLTDLTQVVEWQVRERTGGCIEHLTVEVDGNRVIVRGCARTCDAKQLATQAALEVLIRTGGDMQIAIEVREDALGAPVAPVARSEPTCDGCATLRPSLFPLANE